MTSSGKLFSRVCWLVVSVALARPSIAADIVTFQDNVLPILRSNCLKCHNPDKFKGDLDLTTLSGALTGGGSGPVVSSGDPDGSKIIKAITHAEEPNMPPNSPPLPDKDVEVIKRWIAGGLLESSGSKAIAANKPKVDLTVSASSAGRPDGPPPMPPELLLEPVVHTARTSVSTALASSPWAPLVALGGQHQILLYHSDRLELLGVLPYPEGFPNDLKFSRNGKLLLVGGGRGSASGQVVVWDVVSGERILTVGDEFDSVLAADVSADQKIVALGGPDRLVKLYSTQDGALLHKIKKHTDWVTALEFSPNGRYLASGDRNGGLVVWETESGQEVYTLTGHKAAVSAVSWRDDSDILASSSEDGTVKIWKVSDGQMVKSITAHAGGALSVRYAHDGRIISCGRDNQVAVWDASGNKQRSLPNPNELPVRATFTHDGARVIASDWTGKVSVWNTADGKAVGELDLNPKSLSERIAATTQRVAELQQRVATTAATAAAADGAVYQAAAALENAPKDPTQLKEIKQRVEDANKHAAATKAEAAQAPANLAAAKSALERLKLGQVYTTVFHAREDLAAHERTRAQLAEEAAAAKIAADQAVANLTEAKKSPAKTKPEKDERARKIKALTELAKSTRAQAVAAQGAVEKATGELASEKARVEKLSAEYQRLKAPLTGLSAKL